MISRGEITRAWGLFHIGALAEVESLLFSRTDADATFIRLWVALRRGDVEGKRTLGSLLANSGDQKLAAIGRAHENVALATLREPLQPWLIPNGRIAQAEVAYARALIAFTQDAPENVREELSKALPQTADQRVRYAQLRAWIYGLREHFENQATHLLHALSLALKENVDRSLVARIADAIAPLVREVDLGELGPRAEQLLEAIDWPIEPVRGHFFTQRALAWRKALQGAWIPAMHLLDGSLALAPDQLHRGLVFADRSRVSRTTGEDISSASSRANAFDCFEAVNWADARSDESVGLFASIDVLSPELERARALFDRADAVVVSGLIGSGHGRRLSAFREFALSHLTDGDEALQHAQAAYKTFKELKYIHRATSCALRAVELGGGARWRERVERLIADYPRSLAAKEYERLTSPMSRIRGRRREVAELLVASNKTAREIGAALGMAEGTVRVHIKHINKILNIESRSQLVRLFLESTSAA
jgi:DNA-binding CsgD family transcriptional regulator